MRKFVGLDISLQKTAVCVLAAEMPDPEQKRDPGMWLEPELGSPEK